MPIIVFIEKDNQEVKKSSFETISYASALAQQSGDEVIGVAIGEFAEGQLPSLGNYGLSTVLHASTDTETWLGQTYASVLAQVVQEKSASVVVLPSSSLTEAIAARLGAKLDASIATNVIGLPDTSSGFVVKKGIFTGKAFAHIDMTQAHKVISVKTNSYPFEVGSGTATVEALSVNIDTTDLPVTIKETKKSEGKVLLPEAELVVSAGRGLKGPENWGMIDELADLIGAATACSKPVSDVDWRPHHEHVGQTGIKISPNLYIAVGISGAIQHLAGVSSSKTIVVINTDEEAPFFKAADYGIVGDAFEVIPRLIEAIKKVS